MIDLAARSWLHGAAAWRRGATALHSVVLPRSATWTPCCWERTARFRAAGPARTLMRATHFGNGGGGRRQFASAIAADAGARPSACIDSPARLRAPRWAGYWLLGSSALVFGIVVVGGLTRLTESGLSITEWRPLTGVVPPLSEEHWLAEFEKYQKTPEYALHNAHLTLSEFKFIYYMEWGHRLLGRVIGAVYLVPAGYLIVRRRVDARLAAQLAGIAALIGLQGFIGWWMVKSGIEGDLRDQGGVPRVSQYRLTTHLGAAFLVYAGMLWTGLGIIRDHKMLALTPELRLAHARQLARSNLRIFKLAVCALSVLSFVTVLSGAVVAGLDAGLIYNEFPYMGNSIMPPTGELLSAHYARTEGDLVWRNALENPTTAQFDHRVLATSTFLSVLALHLYALRLRGTLPGALMNGTRALMAIATLQFALGISTLVYLVPIPLAAAHQAGSLALWTAVLVLGRACILPRYSRLLTASSGAASRH